jgi:hypothetical protein
MDELAEARLALVSRLMRIGIKILNDDLCKEGWDGERICTVHDYQWLEKDPVCNAVSGTIEDLEREE